MGGNVPDHINIAGFQ